MTGTSPGQQLFELLLAWNLLKAVHMAKKASCFSTFQDVHWIFHRLVG